MQHHSLLTWHPTEKTLGLGFSFHDVLPFFSLIITPTKSEYDQEIPQSHNTDQPTAQ